MSSSQETPGHLKSDFPVGFVRHPALFYTPEKFDAYSAKYIKPGCNSTYMDSEIWLRMTSGNPAKKDVGDVVCKSTDANSTAEVVDNNATGPRNPARADVADSHPFVSGLLQTTLKPQLSTNHMLTHNADVAFRSSENALVDLFTELEEVVTEARLSTLLRLAWIESPLTTLKIIFNARSIHLGKSSRNVFYRCIDWLSMYHPATCLYNLQWLPRPIIEKKVPKDNGEEEIIFVEPEKDEDDPSRFDVRNGMAHGYYKDLLNILALSVNDKLKDPRSMLNVFRRRNGKDIVWDREEAAEKRHELRDHRHHFALRQFHENTFYRHLHIMVARVFAHQLQSDLKLLRSNEKEARRNISLCAKWAPSSKGFHDKHTFIVTSIAEILHSKDEFPGVPDRTTYLRHAREAYRKDISALRKELQIVERDLSANNFQNIKYDRVPSLAMSNYRKVFLRKDRPGFTKYLLDVAEGKANISGATLLPSTMIRDVRKSNAAAYFSRFRVKGPQPPEPVDKVVDLQWKTMVQRIRDSGSLENSIAICDVSGSMSALRFPDGTTPMDSSIALSLLVAEVVKPPFGGIFITFSGKPEVVRVDLSKGLHDKVSAIESSNWGYNTNFTAVFEDLILPMALENKLKQQDMVRRVFVFSDMQFDAAVPGVLSTKTALQRIEAKYKIHGYEMPEIIFWNLAGGKLGTAPKHATSNEHNVALVSGYSQGMLKVFLDNGGFDSDDSLQDTNRTEVESDSDDDFARVRHKRQKMDPLYIVNKATGHKAYDMLKVID